MLRYVIYREMIERADISLHLVENDIKIITMEYAGQNYHRVELEEEEASVIKLKFPDVKIYPYHHPQ